MEDATITATGLDTWRRLLKGLAGKYDWLRITEHYRGLHVFNVPKEIDLLLWYEQRKLCGRYIYGTVTYRDGKMKYVSKDVFDSYMRQMIGMEDDVQEETDKQEESDLRQ